MIQQNFRLTRKIIKAIDAYRKGRIVGNHEMKKTEAVSALLEGAIEQNQLLKNEFEQGFKDIRIVLDKIYHCDHLTATEIKIFFAYLYDVGSRDYPMAIDLVLVLFDIVIEITRNITFKTEASGYNKIQYFIGNTPQRKIKNIHNLNLSQLMEAHKQCIIESNNSKIFDYYVEMTLRNCAVIVRDFEIPDLINANKIIMDNRKVLYRRSLFYTNFLYKKSGLASNVSNILDQMYQYEKNNKQYTFLFSQKRDLNRDVYVTGKYSFNESLYVIINSFIEFQLAKIGCTGHTIPSSEYKYITYRDGRLGYNFNDFGFVESKDVEAFLTLLQEVEKDNLPLFELMKDTYGEIA